MRPATPQHCSFNFRSSFQTLLKAFSRPVHTARVFLFLEGVFNLLCEEDDVILCISVLSECSSVFVIVCMPVPFSSLLFLIFLKSVPRLSSGTGEMYRYELPYARGAFVFLSIRKFRVFAELINFNLTSHGQRTWYTPKPLQYFDKF